MSDNKENELVVSSASAANFANEPVASETDLKTKLDLIEKNVEFLLELGRHQDKILKQVTGEVLRLSNIAKNSGLKGSSAGDDCHNYQIYVGNINPRTNNDDVRKYFEKFGVVNEFFILRVHDCSKNGIVHFGKKQSVEEALNGRPHLLDERLLVVNRSHGRRRFGKENATEKVSPMKAGKAASRSNRYSPY